MVFERPFNEVEGNHAGEGSDRGLRVSDNPDQGQKPPCQGANGFYRLCSKFLSPLAHAW